MKVEAYELKKSGVIINKARFEKEVARQKGIHATACYKLYEGYFQSSPSLYNPTEVLSAFKQEFPEYFNMFVSDTDASVTWDETWCSYVKTMAVRQKASEEVISFLTTFEQVISSLEALKSLDNLASRCHFGGKFKPNAFIEPRVEISTYVGDSSKYKCDNPAIRRVLNLSPSSVLISVNSKGIMRDTAASMLGVSDKDIQKLKEMNKPYFSKWLTSEDEIKYLELFLSGKVSSTGIMSKLLKKRLAEDNNYRVTDNGGMVVDQKFIDKVFINSLDARCNFVTEKRKELLSKYSVVKPYYLTGDEVIFEVSKYEVSDDITDDFKVPERFTGTLMYDYVSKTKLPAYCMLDGNFGEFISKMEVEKNGYYTEAKPLMLKFLNKNNNNSVNQQTVPCYNISDVYYSAQRNEDGELITKTLESSLPDSISKGTPQTLWSEYHAVSRYDFFQKIKRSVTKTLVAVSEAYLDLVAELVCAFKYFDSCSATYTRVNSCYDYVTKDMYTRACYDANEIYTKI